MFCDAFRIVASGVLLGCVETDHTARVLRITQLERPVTIAINLSGRAFRSSIVRIKRIISGKTYATLWSHN